MYRGANGKFLTEALFFETNRDRSVVAPVFTLKDREHEGLPSLKTLYLSYSDPTEYRFSTEVLGSFQHWNVLCACVWFKPHIEEWRRELDAKIKSSTVVAARSILEDPNASESSRLQAAKFLADHGWETKAKKGRPTKKQVAEAAREQAEHSDFLEDDYARIQINH